MAKKYSKKVPEKWVTFPEDKDIQLLITPFTYTYLSMIPTDETVSPSLSLEIFIKSVKEWKGILDESDKLMECNENTRESVAKQDNRLLSWAFNEIMTFTPAITKVSEKEVKN